MKTNRILKLLPPVTIAGILAGVYLSTMAPGLTWANYGSDGGDLISAAYSGGVAHPTGYPVYLLVAAIFQKLPVGSLALRTNLLSACTMILSALFIYKTVDDTIRLEDVDGCWLAGMVAALAFGLTPIVWSQAVITEVYGLHALFVSILVYLAMRPLPKWKWLGIFLGLAAGNHVTSLLMIPGLFPLLLAWRRENKNHGMIGGFGYISHRILSGVLLAMAVGLASYLTLALRALHSSAVIWGDPTSLEGLIWLGTGQMYRENFIFFTSTEQILGRLWELFTTTFHQLDIWGVALSWVGLVHVFRFRTLPWISIWMVLVYSSFAFFYRVVDGYVYLIPVFIVLSIWVGLGVHAVIHSGIIRRWPWMAGVVGVMLILVGVDRVITSWDQADASRDMRAEQFGEEMMEALPEQSLVFTNGDRTTFSLRYFHYTLGRRPDIFLISSGLLEYDWYRDNLQKIYPDLVVPQNGDDTWIIAFEQNNPGHPICHVYYDRDAILYCKDGNDP